jgi:hypothetical protein
MRKGLAGAFEAVIAAGKPILTMVSERHRSVWEIFASKAICLIVLRSGACRHGAKEQKT